MKTIKNINDAEKELVVAFGKDKPDFIVGVHNMSTLLKQTSIEQIKLWKAELKTVEFCWDNLNNKPNIRLVSSTLATEDIRRFAKIQDRMEFFNISEGDLE